MHYDASGVAQPAGLDKAGRAIATAPVTCELCHVGLSGHDKLAQHCAKKHASLAEYRKRVFYKAREAGLCELPPWVKRSMVQSFQFFRLHSVPSSLNDWIGKAHVPGSAQPRREEACVVCAVKDWLENRYPVNLFQTSTGTTTWAKFFFAIGDEACEHEEAHEDNSAFGGVAQPAEGTLLVGDSGAFCLGPKEKIDAILNVQRYIEQWPLIPVAELHASSVQHPDDFAMRWLLHSRRVPCAPHSGVSQPADIDALPRSAGVGDKHATVWCCRLCVDNLCRHNPKMPPLALANSNFGGRHPPLFREATIASRMLASSISW